jgi:hypothetical protein
MLLVRFHRNRQAVRALFVAHLNQERIRGIDRFFPRVAVPGTPLATSLFPLAASRVLHVEQRAAEFSHQLRRQLCES